MNKIIEKKPRRITDHKKKVMHPWDTTEDTLLLNAIARYGENNWSEIAECLPNRNRKQCKERYINNLMHKNNKRPWTQEEDNIILSKRMEYGNKWSKISMFLIERSPNNVKNRFFGHLKKFVENEYSHDGVESSVVSGSSVEHSHLSVFTPVNKADYCVVTYF